MTDDLIKNYLAELYERTTDEEFKGVAHNSVMHGILLGLVEARDLLERMLKGEE